MPQHDQHARELAQRIPGLLANRPWLVADPRTVGALDLLCSFVDSERGESAFVDELVESALVDQVLKHCSDHRSEPTRAQVACIMLSARVARELSSEDITDHTGELDAGLVVVKLLHAIEAAVARIRGRVVYADPVGSRPAVFETPTPWALDRKEWELGHEQSVEAFTWLRARGSLRHPIALRKEVEVAANACAMLMGLHSYLMEGAHFGGASNALAWGLDTRDQENVLVLSGNSTGVQDASGTWIPLGAWAVPDLERSEIVPRVEGGVAYIDSACLSSNPSLGGDFDRHRGIEVSKQAGPEAEKAKRAAFVRGDDLADSIRKAAASRGNHAVDFINVAGLCVLGDLSLAREQIGPRIAFEDCQFYAQRKSAGLRHDEFMRYDDPQGQAAELGVRAQLDFHESTFADLTFSRCTLGMADFRSARIQGNLTLRDCSVTSVNLSGAQVQAVKLSGIGALPLGDRWPVQGNLTLLDPEVAREPHCEARYLTCRSMQLDGVWGGIDLSQIDAAEGVFLGQQCLRARYVSLDRANVGIVYSDRTSVVDGGRFGLEAATVHRNLFLTCNTVITGPFNLREAKVAGPVQLQSRWLGADHIAGIAVDIEGAVIEGSLVIGNVTQDTRPRSPRTVPGDAVNPTVSGRISLREARVMGNVGLGRVVVRTPRKAVDGEAATSPDRPATEEWGRGDRSIDLVGLEVTGAVWIRDLDCEGRLVGSGLKSDALSIKRTRIRSDPGGLNSDYGPRPLRLGNAALDLDRAAIERVLKVTDSRIEGDVSLDHSVAGSVSLGWDTDRATDRAALVIVGSIRASGLRVSGPMYVDAAIDGFPLGRNPFIRLTDASISDLRLSARFAASDAAVVRVTGARIRSIQVAGLGQDDGRKVFASAQALAIVQSGRDEVASGAGRSWDGLGFEALASAVATAGDLDDALDIAVMGEKSRDRMSRGTGSTGIAGWAGRRARQFWGWAADFGYRPAKRLRLIVGLIAIAVTLVLVGWVRGWYQHDSAVSSTVSSADQCPVGVPCFSPLAYILDVLVPPLDLGQVSEWPPTTALLSTALALCTFFAWTLSLWAAAALTSSSRRFLVGSSRGE